MCTAITYQGKNHYFGRNLDYERTFGEKIVISPRNYPWSYKKAKAPKGGYAMIGTAVTEDGYPLYFDALNETGVAMAGLHFVGNAHYHEPVRNREQEIMKKEIAPYEMIPWILTQCSDMKEVRRLLDEIIVVAIPFKDNLPLSPLHFMVADERECIVVEPVKEGLMVYDNPAHVLTNNPPFPFHMEHLKNYMNLTGDVATNRFSDKLKLTPYSRGMGAIGLPGDMSSSSRFVRAAFVRANSVSEKKEAESVNQFFHILGAVEQVKGCVRLENGACEITTYSSCCNLEEGIYYYRTYENTELRSISMRDFDLESSALYRKEM